MSPGFKRVIFLISGSIPLAPGHWRTCAGFPPAEVGPGQCLGPPQRDGWFPACRGGPVGLRCGQSVWVPWWRRSVLTVRPGAGPHLPGAVSARVGRHPGGSPTSTCRTVGPQTQESPTARHLLVDAARSALSGCRPVRPVMAPSSLQDRHDSACGNGGSRLDCPPANRRRSSGAQPPAQGSAYRT